MYPPWVRPAYRKVNIMPIYQVSTNRSRTLYGYTDKAEAMDHASGVAAHGGTATVTNTSTGGKALFALIDGVVKVKVIPA
jgi:hypothetical protein